MTAKRGRRRCYPASIHCMASWIFIALPMEMWYLLTVELERNPSLEMVVGEVWSCQTKKMLAGFKGKWVYSLYSVNHQLRVRLEKKSTVAFLQLHILTWTVSFSLQCLNRSIVKPLMEIIEHLKCRKDRNERCYILWTLRRSNATGILLSFFYGDWFFGLVPKQPTVQTLHYKQENTEFKRDDCTLYLIKCLFWVFQKRKLLYK